MTPAAFAQDPSHRRLLIVLGLAQLALAAVVVAAQAYFVYAADDQSSPAGLYEVASQIFVALFALGVGIAGRGSFETRAPLLAVGAVFAAIVAHEIIYWRVETALEDWSALGLWVAASLALVFVSRRRRLSRAAALLLAVAAVSKLAAIGADIADEGSFAEAPSLAALSWTYLLSTALSAAALQLGFLHLASRPVGSLAERLGFSREHGVGAHVAGVIADMRYKAWARANPGKNYGDYYGARLSARLARGGRHRTLGAVARPVEAGEDARRWAAEEFAGRGLSHRDWFFARGVEPSMVCVDYGCGSLRVGQHFIRRLAAGNWFGLDVVDRFWKDGLTLIEPETIAEKRPGFATIGPEGLAKAEALRPDLVYSTAVMQHVPPAELSVYVGNLARIAGESGVVCANFKRMAATRRIGPNAWALSAAEVARAVEAAGEGSSFVIEDDGAEPGEDFAKATLVMARDPAALGRWARRPLPGYGFAETPAAPTREGPAAS
ncbi:hypothetical protein ACFOWB_23910 [Chenggangzhangella methanolivorans]